MEKIWIDALEFEDYGGFIRDTQYVREMGQGYLLANSVGTPVAPAKVKFEVRETGWYRLWVRTKNWCVGHEPDGIELTLDGFKCDVVCGRMQLEHWYFEAGGDFYLEPGTHTLSVYDTTGWFGRFAAVIITNDLDFTPSPEQSRWKRQRLEMKGLTNTVTDHGHFDLLIVGGGVPGVTAAVTAARQGLRVALISDRPVLGGNGSEEADVALEGAAHRGYHETGVIYEMKNVRQAERITWSETFARFVRQEPNISLFSNMLVDDAMMDGAVIRGVHAVDTLDLSEHTFTADQFVDDTGDGWLGYYAGADYHIGRESKLQYGESFAPEQADGNTMSGCNTGTVRDFADTICSYLAEETDKEVTFTPPSWAFPMPQGEQMCRTPRKIVRGEWWLENRNDYDDLWEGEYTRDALLRVAIGYYDWLKNSWPEREKAKNLRLKVLGTFNAKRETRRLLGDYVLTQNDYEHDVWFEDAVCYSGWNIDVHHIMGIFSGAGGAFNLNEKIPITQIPFRCLYSRNVDNLMMVGRCVSVSHVGLGPNRVMLTGASMAQAVATAAWLCKKYGLTPREGGKQHMEELQQILLKDGQSIPGVFNRDPADLARKARITADSWTPEGAPENVVNGRNRPTDGEPHAWISLEGLPQSLTLTLPEQTKIHQVRLTLEVPFDRYTYGYMEMPVMEELLTDFTVEVLTDGDWKEVAAVQDNIQRLVVLDFPPVIAEAVRIHALKTVQAQYAVIPEVRIY